MKGPSCETVRSLFLELLSTRPVVSTAGPVRAAPGGLGSRAGTDSLDM